MAYDRIRLAHDQGLATLTLNAPDKLNAVSRKMIAELKDCWEKLATDGSVRAVLLTGAGRGFCAGADLSDPDRGKEGGDSGHLPAGLRAHRAAARRRQHLVPAAPGRRAAGAGAHHAGAADHGRAGQ